MPLFKPASTLANVPPQDGYNMMAGIISYLPDDTRLADTRIEAHMKQLEWLRQFQLPTTVVEQNYGLRLLHPRDSVIRYTKGIGPSAARNEILKKFYNSRYDWLLLLDDDVRIYEYYDYTNLIRQMREYPDDFKKLDGFTCIVPNYVPFRQANKDDKTFNTHWKMQRLHFGEAVPILFMRNLKKFYDDEIYFDDSFSVSDDKIREDIEFHLRFAQKYRMYQSTVMIGNFFNMHPEDSTLWLPERDGSVEREWKRNVLRHIGREDLIGEDKITWSALPNVAEKELYIEKRIPSKIDHETKRNLA
jgi:hypothetical protein